MPLYEYKCPNGHLFEAIHGMTEDGPSVCEVCGEAPLQRVLYPVAVHYKGSGFYSTDYGKKGAAAPSSSSSSSETKSDTPKSDTPKTDSKPAETKPSSSSTSSD